MVFSNIRDISQKNLFVFRYVSSYYFDSGSDFKVKKKFQFQLATPWEN